LRQSSILGILREHFERKNKMTKFLHFNIQLGSRSKKMRKQFQSRTVAADAPTSETVSNLANAYLGKVPGQDLFAYVNVGITFLSLKDMYNKETGRKEAVAKQKLEKFKITSVEATETHIFVRLEAIQGVALSLRTNKATGFTTVCGHMVSESGAPYDLSY